jgi:hypothetical protein
VTASDWGTCPHRGGPLITWETIMEMGSKHPVQVLVRCPNEGCDYDEFRTTPQAAEADLRALLEELS